MNKYPEVQWSFKMEMRGEGKNLEEAFHDAVMMSGLGEHVGTECEPVIESFTCPCGEECIAVQSENKCDLKNEFARDYVCKIDGRRWTVDFEGEVYEQRRWVVLAGNASGGFENCWFEDLGSAEAQQMPCTFNTKYSAEHALDEHIRSCTEAFAKGDMADFPKKSEFEIVDLREYLNLDELEAAPDGWHFGAKIYDADGRHYINQYVTDYGDEDVKIEWMLGKTGWEAHWEGSEEAFYIGSLGDLPTREDFVEAHDILHNRGGVS